MPEVFFCLGPRGEGAFFPESALDGRGFSVYDGDMGITLHSEGAAGEVTGSKHVIEIDGHRLLVDCGAFQGKREEADAKNRRLLERPDLIEASVLTHGHYDHCGLYPLLVKRGFAGSVFSTPATRDLANLIMMDSAAIQSRDAEYLSKQAAKKGEKFTWQPLYQEKDVIEAISRFITVSYGRPFSPVPGVMASFSDAGHILGSATLRLTMKDQGGKELAVCFSGDLGRKGKPIIRDPDSIEPVDYLVLESTYGDRLHESSDNALDTLAEVVNRVYERQGKLIIPAFAVERTQELIYYLHMLADQKRIPTIPIWCDSPMAINATAIFQIHPECYDQDINQAFVLHHKNPFGFNQLKFASSVEESKSLNDMPGPMIIISADGMCEAGRIQHHLINNIQDPRNAVLIVGYMAEDTLGRRIQEKRPTVRIHGQVFDLRAEVMEINAFSAHADYEEIGDWLSMVDRSRLKGIFLVHGERESQIYLRDYLKAKGYPEPVINEYGERYELV
jgi:metallo-beta-lactamase family protein